MFGNVKPLAIVVGGPPPPGPIPRHEPCVVPLAKFGESFLTSLSQRFQIKIEIISHDRFSRGIAKFHWQAPFFLPRVGNIFHGNAVGSIQLVELLDRRQVHERRADPIGFVVEKEVQVLCDIPFVERST